MKNGRTISIKDPKLQRIRNNFRLIILEECSRRKSEIRNQEYNFTRDKDGNYVKPSEEGVNILQKLNDKSWEIERPLRASIVKCALCGKHNRDMTYHQKSHSWYCVQCYKRRLS